MSKTVKTEKQKVVSHIDEQATEITTNKARSEANRLTQVLAVWPDSPPAPETIEALVVFGKNPEAKIKLMVVQNDKTLPPYTDLESFSQHVKLTDQQQEVVRLAKQYLNWDFKYLHYLEIKSEKVKLKKEAEQQIREANTTYAATKEAEQLKASLDVISEALTKVGVKIPAFQSPLDAIWHMFEFSTGGDGKMVVTPNGAHINSLAAKYINQ